RSARLGDGFVEMLDVAVVDVGHQAVLAKVLGDLLDHAVLVPLALAAIAGGLPGEVVADVAVDEVPDPGRLPPLTLCLGWVFAEVYAAAEFLGFGPGRGDGPGGERADRVTLLDPGDSVGDEERARPGRVQRGGRKDAEPEPPHRILVAGVPEQSR